MKYYFISFLLSCNLISFSQNVESADLKKWFIANFKCLSGNCENGIGKAENESFILEGKFENYKLSSGKVSLKKGIRDGLENICEGTFYTQSYGPNLTGVVPELKQGTNTYISSEKDLKIIQKGDFNSEGHLEGTGERWQYKLNGKKISYEKNIKTGKWNDGDLDGHGLWITDDTNFDGMFVKGSPEAKLSDEDGFVNCMVCGKKGKLKGEVFDLKAFFIDGNGFGPFCSSTCESNHYKYVNGKLTGVLADLQKQSLLIIKCSYCTNPSKVIRRDCIIGKSDGKEYCSQKCACEANKKNCY